MLCICPSALKWLGVQQEIPIAFFLSSEMLQCCTVLLFYVLCVRNECDQKTLQCNFLMLLHKMETQHRRVQHSVNQMGFNHISIEQLAIAYSIVVLGHHQIYPFRIPYMEIQSTTQFIDSINFNLLCF